MTTILSSDTIFATIRQRGRLLLTLRFCGITSLGDIVCQLKGQIKGLTTISLRNSTQGWTCNHTVMMPAA